MFIILYYICLIWYWHFDTPCFAHFIGDLPQQKVPPAPTIRPRAPQKAHLPGAKKSFHEANTKQFKTYFNILLYSKEKLIIKSLNSILRRSWFCQTPKLLKTKRRCPFLFCQALSGLDMHRWKRGVHSDKTEHSWESNTNINMFFSGKGLLNSGSKIGRFSSTGALIAVFGWSCVWGPSAVKHRPFLLCYKTRLDRQFPHDFFGYFRIWKGLKYHTHPQTMFCDAGTWYNFNWWRDFVAGCLCEVLMLDSADGSPFGVLSTRNMEMSANPMD